MTLDELLQACDEAERQGLPLIVVNVPRRRVGHRQYRIARGLSGAVIGSTRAGMVTITLRCSLVRAYVEQARAREVKK